MKPQKKRAKKQAVEVPTSSELDKKPPSYKQKKQLAKQVRGKNLLIRTKHTYQ